MATYAIGDVQGCCDALQRLLRILPLKATDNLWLAGDLVNRGPDSLGVLRWAMAQRHLTAVMGNHDLHLLTRLAGLAAPKRRDTLDAVIAAPDSSAIANWLRHLPLLHRDGNIAMVHAGLHPQWTLEEAESRARVCERLLRGPDWRAFLLALEAGGSAQSDTSAAVETMAILTRIRTCTAQGVPCAAFNGPPQLAPPGCLPWYSHASRRSFSHTIVFGHWAALGLRIEKSEICVDSGCVWGTELTAVRLEDRAVFAVPAVATA